MSRLTSRAGAASTEKALVAAVADPTGVSADSVQARAGSLKAALESGGGCLPAAGVDQAEVAIAKTLARSSITGTRTVVALAGATGSGKSSLFNAIIGAEVARVGARRPTTSTPTAAVWGSESASALLDWLRVGTRYLVDKPVVVDERLVLATAPGSEVGGKAASVLAQSPGLALDGLVLLDLPDFDSAEASHRVEAERMLDLVDVFVWVTDPQKYADARLHQDYIAKLSAHDAVTVTVLNQADRLTPEALESCRADLVRLLQADGVADPALIVTSVADGSGVVDLSRRIGAVVEGHNAAARRLDSDLRSAAMVLLPFVADSEPVLDDVVDARLVDALTRAAGIPVILDAVERDFRRETWARTGWPFTRWARALRPSPLRRLRLDNPTGQPGQISQSDIRSVLGRSSLPSPTPAARSAVALAARELGDRAGRDLPQAWTDEVGDACLPSDEHLGDALDQAVVATSLRARNPLWWNVFGYLQWAMTICAVAGFAWLVILMALGWLQLPADPPRFGPLPYPFLLFVGGLVLGSLTSLLARAIGRVGARRRKSLVAARLRKSVAQVARDQLVAPVQQVLDRHRKTRENLAKALAVRSQT